MRINKNLNGSGGNLIGLYFTICKLVASSLIPSTKSSMVEVPNLVVATLGQYNQEYKLLCNQNLFSKMVQILNRFQLSCPSATLSNILITSNLL